MLRPGSAMMIHVNGLGYAPQNLARVVVWEWLNEHGRWRPYSAAVCHHIENVLKGDSRGTVVLGQVEPQLAPYIIDLQSMHQFRQDTETEKKKKEVSFGYAMILRPGSAMMIHVNGLGYAPQNLARVVVWEWLNEHGRWRPYSAAVCHHIENVLKGDSRGTVVLGQVEPQLAPYIIDLQSMHQFRQDTGTMRPAQRNFYEPSSAPGKGVVWEWENDSGSWTPYDMEICVTVQNAYEKQHPWLDLTSLGFCYLIDFNSMTQTNRQSQRKRRLRRRMDLAYPLTTGSIPKSQSWPVGTSSGQPCSCQQCILVNSTRAASNAILASQRRKVYTGANGAHGTLTLVRQSNTFAGTTLWSPTSSVSSGSAKPEQVQSPATGTTYPRVPALPAPIPASGQNNLNRPGPQRSALVRTRGSIPPG
ncbi:UNVERIFIED_CONTAM: hypothetical protein FKN15_028628 [Acipenser sinensis]